MPLTPLERGPAEGAATLGEARAYAALRTDARVVASGILGLFRPGPGSSLDAIQAGPRGRVLPSTLYRLRMRTTARGDVRLAVLAGGVPQPRIPTTAAQVRGQLATRRAVAGKAPPMSYTYQYVGPTGLGGDPTAAVPGEAPAKLTVPGCTDCG